MNFREARIHAHVCSDGWLSEYIEKHVLQVVHGRRYYRDRRRYEVGYANNEKKLLKEFDDDMNVVFGVRCKRNTGERRTKSKRIFTRLKKLGAGKSKEWFIGAEIIRSNKKTKRVWLRAFFDDEGTVDLKEKRIRIKIKNESGVKQAAKMLSTLGIESQITGENRDETWFLTINRKNAARFKKLVGFNQTKKKRLLKKIVGAR